MRSITHANARSAYAAFTDTLGSSSKRRDRDAGGEHHQARDAREKKEHFVPLASAPAPRDF
jgi:hypothetical protein